MRRAAAVAAAALALCIGLCAPAAGAEDASMRIVEVDTQYAPDVSLGVTVDAPPEERPLRPEDFSVSPRDASATLTVRPIDPSEYDIGLVVAATSPADLGASRRVVADLLLALPPTVRVTVPAARRVHGDPASAAAVLTDIDVRTPQQVRADTTVILERFARGTGGRQVVVLVTSAPDPPGGIEQPLAAAASERRVRMIGVSIARGGEAPGWLRDLATRGRGTTWAIADPADAGGVGRQVAEQLIARYAVGFRLPAGGARDVTVTARAGESTATATVRVAPQRGAGRPMESGSAADDTMWLLVAVASVAALVLVALLLRTLPRRRAAEAPATAQAVTPSTPATPPEAERRPGLVVLPDAGRTPAERGELEQRLREALRRRAAATMSEPPRRGPTDRGAAT